MCAVDDSNVREDGDGDGHNADDRLENVLERSEGNWERVWKKANHIGNNNT